MTLDDADGAVGNRDLLAAAYPAVDEQRLALVIAPPLGELALGLFPIVLDPMHRVVPEDEGVRRRIFRRGCRIHHRDVESLQRAAMIGRERAKTRVESSLDDRALPCR